MGLSIRIRGAFEYSMHSGTVGADEAGGSGIEESGRSSAGISTAGGTEGGELGGKLRR